MNRSRELVFVLGLLVALLMTGCRPIQTPAGALDTSEAAVPAATIAVAPTPAVTPTPAMAWMPDQFFGVWGSSPNDVFFARRDGTILHYDGSAWTPMESGTDSAILSVWSSAPDDVFALGWGGTPPAETFPTGCCGAILHYDGSRWAPMDAPTTSLLHGLWGSAGDDIYVIGAGDLILHYDGKAWSIVPHETE